MIGKRPVGRGKPFLFLVIVGAIGVGPAPEQTLYWSVSNKELKPRVMQLVNNIRELTYAYKRQDGELLATLDRTQRAETTASERKRIREQWIRESDRLHGRLMREYKEKYWAQTILFRNELYRRLPRSFRQSQLAGIYQYPTNLLGVEAIADHLELLAKSLPER